MTMVVGLEAAGAETAGAEAAGAEEATSFEGVVPLLEPELPPAQILGPGMGKALRPL